MKIRAALKDKQLKFVRKNLERARANPAKCGLAMKERGLYSPKTNDQDLEMFVLGLIRTVDKEIKLERQPKLPGLFPDEEITAKRIGEKWAPEEDDAFLDRFLSGLTPERLAVRLNRTPKAIKRHWEEFKYDERNTATNYRAYKRSSRQGRRITPIEQELIDAHRERGVLPEVTACLLQRKTNEFVTDFKSIIKNNRLKDVAGSADLLLAHRYLYWCAKQPIISDEAYDQLKSEELEFGGAESVLLQPASDKPIHYPAHIRHLAFYMQFKDWENKGEPRELEDKMPHGMVSEHKKKKAA